MQMERPEAVKTKKQNVKSYKGVKTMINRELFEKTKELCGCVYGDSIDEEFIQKSQDELGVIFPKSYIDFLLEIHEGGIVGTYFNGIDGDYLGVVIETQKYREKENIPLDYVVVEMYGIHGKRWLFCLDTGRMENDECPVVKYEIGTGEVTVFANNFAEAFDMAVEEQYFEETGHHFSEYNPEERKETKKQLPTGTGYRSSWACIEGANQKSIASTILQNEEQYSYMDGLKKVNEAPYENRLIMVTEDYKGTNFVIGDGLAKIFCELDQYKEKMATFDKVYVYMTERVSDCHGFALLEKGEVKRFYYYDEEGVRSTGEWTEEEKRLGYHFPANQEEKNRELTDDSITRMNEDAIVCLAIERMGINIESYPYGNVIIGNMKTD